MANYFEYSRDRLVELNREKQHELWKLQDKGFKTREEQQRIVQLSAHIYGIKQAIAMHDSQMDLGL